MWKVERSSCLAYSAGPSRQSFCRAENCAQKCAAPTRTLSGVWSSSARRRCARSSSVNPEIRLSRAECTICAGRQGRSSPLEQAMIASLMSRLFQESAAVAFGSWSKTVLVRAGLGSSEDCKIRVRRNGEYWQCTPYAPFFRRISRHKCPQLSNCA